MQWSDIREYADYQIALPFSANIEIDLPSEYLSTPRGRSAALLETDANVEQFCIRIAREFADSRASFAELTSSSNLSDQLLPWLPWRLGEHSPLAITLLLGQLSARFSIERPLPGQRLERSIDIASVAASSYPQVQARPLIFILEEVRFEDGSLISKIKGFFVVTGATLTLAIGALATPPGQDFYYDLKFSNRIEETVKGQSCNTIASWNIDLSSLRALGLDALNYEKPGLKDEERALRVCNVQLALITAQGSPKLIDGKDGLATRNALKYYAAQKGLPASIQDERLRGFLLEELQKRRTQ
jgi:hypothetical protein